MTADQRNALASGPGGIAAPPPPVTFTPSKSAFAVLEATTMGTLGTSKDGYDSLYAPLIAAVPSHAVQLAAMDKNIAAASFKPGAINATIFAPVGTKIIALAKVGDAQIGDYGTAVGVPTGTPPPAPPPNRNPNGGGGGGAHGCSPGVINRAMTAIQATVAPTFGRFTAKAAAHGKFLQGPCDPHEGTGNNGT